MEKKIPDNEQSREDVINALASLAARFGIQLEHYGRMKFHLTFKGDKDYSQWFGDETLTEEEIAALDAEIEAELEAEPVTEESEPEEKSEYRAAKEPESPSALVAQILTLLHPKVKCVFGSSAIYQILSEAASAYGREGSSVEEKINGMSFPSAAQAWIISKRIFATNHLDDLVRMIELLMLGDESSEAVMEAGEPVSFEEITEKDRKEVIEYCQFIISQNETESNDSDADQAVESLDKELREITELQPSDNLVFLSSAVSRNLMTLAKGIGSGEKNVGTAKHPVFVKATIGKDDGKESVTLNRTDYDVMEAVGQIVQENGKGIIVTPSQIFRKISFSNSRPSPQTIDEIVASMDKLLFTPSTIDFTQQIEKHTKLKSKNKDIENGKVKGAIVGNIISGLHMKRFSTSYRGRAVEHSFLIYDMPMFYYYSQTVKQLVTIPGYLLSGNSPKDKTAPKKSHKQQPTQKRLSLTEIGLRRYLLEQIEYFKRLRDKKQQHTFYFVWETISKDIGYEIDTPKRLRMLREQTYEFLQEQVAKKNIKSCNYKYKGRAVHSIKITL